ncbi:MAG: hypothetical protein AAGD04_14960 [Pseudomonadota bacterium]
MDLTDPAVFDPKGLIRESYKIEGITPGECRSIFLDWAINVAAGQDTNAHIKAALAYYGAGAPDHPMTRVLQDGLGAAPKAARRGGRAGRLARPEAEDTQA